MKMEVHDYHLPLPIDIYDLLRDEAQRQHQPATRIARMAIEHWLGEQKQGGLHQAIAAYALESGGTEDDLDVGLEQAGVEALD
jgi:hypothetical protein